MDTSYGPEPNEVLLARQWIQEAGLDNAKLIQMESSTWDLIEHYEPISTHIPASQILEKVKAYIKPLRPNFFGDEEVVNKLIIHTRYPSAVYSLLLSEELVERHNLPTHSRMIMDIDHPDDGMSQALHYWLAMAQGCQLITSYSFQERNR